MMDHLTELLVEGRHSLVVESSGKTTVYNGRGISDLYRLYTTSPELLNGARVADKVVGKGAAALMVLSKISRMHALTISTPALHLLKQYGIKVTYGTEVPNIINRTATGICPVEQLCASASTATECFPLIQKFITELSCKQPQ